MFKSFFLVNKAYSYGRQAERYRQMGGISGNADASMNDEKGIKCLEEAVSASFFRKATIKRILIRVCIGVAEDYLQINDLSNSIRISEIIYKYGSTLKWLGLVVKPTFSGLSSGSDLLAPLVKELADYYIEKMDEIEDLFGEKGKKEALEISKKLKGLITYEGVY
jgi:hypothetical protein